MKAIFTYPQNAGTSYIDPVYIGDDTSGFQGRIKDLVDGNYKAWTGTIPSDTVTNIMSELSKFNDATWLEASSGNNTIYDFWLNPLYTGTVEIISSDISSASTTQGVASNIEFSGDHGFYDAQYMTLSGFDGSYSALNGNDYYVKKIDADTIQLCTDVDLTLPLEFHDIQNAILSDALINAGGNVDLNIDTALHNDLTNNLEVILSNFDGTMSEHNGDTFYVQNLTANDFNLSYDAAGNNMLGYPVASLNDPMTNVVLAPWTDISTGVGSGPVVIQLPSPSGDNLPFGSRVSFNMNDAVTHGPQGQWSNGIWQGPSSMLNAAGNSNTPIGDLFVKALNPSQNTYELFYDALCTIPVESNISSSPWVLTGPVTGQGGSITVDTPVTLDRIGDTYTFRMQYSNTQSQDLTGYNLIQIVNKDLDEEWQGFGPQGTGGFRGWGQRVTGDYYTPYQDYARTKIANLGFHILNASKIVYASDDRLLFLKGNLDDQGNILTNKDIILNEDTLTTLISNGGGTNRDQVLANLDNSLLSWTLTNQTNYTNGIIYPGYASVTGQPFGAALPEQTLDGNAIIKISSTAGGGASESVTIQEDWDSSPYTEFTTGLFSSLTGGSSWVVPMSGYNKTTGTSDWSIESGTFFTTLETMYLADPSTVLGRPFVFGWDYDVATGDDDGTPYVYNPTYPDKPATGYMIPVGYRTYTDAGDDMAQFWVQVYEIDEHDSNYGEIGKNAKGFAGSEFIPGQGQGMFSNLQLTGNEKVLKTYLENTFVSSRTPLAEEEVLTAIDWAKATPSRVNVTSKLRTGDLVEVKYKEVATGEITDLGEYIANVTADYSSPDVDGNFDTWVMFLEIDGLRGWANHVTRYGGIQVSLPTAVTSPLYEVIIETRYDSVLSSAGAVTPGGLITPTVDNNVYMHDTLHKSLYTDGEVYSGQIGTVHTQVTTYDIGYDYTDSTTGQVQEIYTPPAPNIIPTFENVDSTTGTLTISNADYPGTTDPQLKYRLSSVSSPMYGNKTYLQRTGDTTYVNNARLKSTSAWGAGQDYQQEFDHFPVTTVSTNASGYLTSGFTFDTEFPGQFSSDGGVAFEVETVPDTYTPPAPTPIELADSWDTDDQWTSAGAENYTKVWPNHILPKSAEIVLNSPTIVNNSQNGIKYSRKSGFTKWTLEVEYPPMRKEDFAQFHGIAQAAQGQAIPFQFMLKDNNGHNILWKKWNQNTDGTTTPLFLEDMAAGASIAMVEGFASNASNAFVTGEVISLDGDNGNGNLHTVLNQVDSNVFGEAKIRLTYPVKEANNIADPLYKTPNSLIVTLNSDDFNYTVDTAEFYYMSVSFTLDNYKA